MRLTIIVGIVALLIGGLLGSAYTGNAKGAEIARIERDHARGLHSAADAASVKLYQAQARSDKLTRDLANARRAVNQLTQERDDAIRLATTGRLCLDARALRVLDAAPGLAPADLPAAGGGAAGAHAAHAATDTDVGRWALAAGDRYAECVRRYHALIEWHEATQ